MPRRPPPFRGLLYTAALLLPAVLTGCAGMLFHPTERHVLDPANHGIEYKDLSWNTGDGRQLHGWFLPASDPAKGTIVYAHGNAQNISTHINSVHWLPDAGYNVLLFDYRGFGKSEGHPTLAGVHTDASAALDVARCFDAPGRIVALGQSIGGSIFTVAVSDTLWTSELAGVAIDSAPTSYRAAAQNALASSWLTWPVQMPGSWLIPDKFSALEAADQLPPIPKLFIGNAGDTAIPLHHSEQLYARATGPKTHWQLNLDGHIATFYAPDVRERFTKWLGQVLPHPGGAQPARSCDGLEVKSAGAA